MRRSAATIALGSLLLAGLALAAPVAAAQSSSGTKSPLDKVTISTPSGAGATAPVLKFPKPLSVKKSTYEIATEGTGAQLTEGEVATVDYVEVDGRTGKVISTTYGEKPQSVRLATKNASVPTIIQALLASKIGGQTLVALAPKDYAKKLQGAIKGVKSTDTIVFMLAPSAAHQSLARAAGAAVAPVDGLPTVALDANGKPTITIPAGVTAPTSLVVQPLIKGDGPVVESGQSVTVHYTGVIWGTGKQFDSSWDRNSPFDFVVGKSQVIPGWDKGLVGQTVGSQVLLVIPPADGYGTSGNSGAGISGTDTLVFVVDILDAY